jgi:hypothetical protein
MGWKVVQRTSVDLLLDQVHWTPYDGPAGKGSPLKATHIGSVRMCNLDICCYKLSDGRLVLDASDVRNLVQVMA